MAQFIAITLSDLEASAAKFKSIEPRGLFYHAATTLVELAIEGNGKLKTAEALAVLLQTWNKAYYQYRPFTEQHFLDIERVIQEHWPALIEFRKRSIGSIIAADEDTVAVVFASFEHVLGPVGAAKSLHLLAPSFFPLWDIESAKAYKVGMRRRGDNSRGYYQFMKITLAQIESLGGNEPIGRNPLKAIDEYNYVEITLKKKAAKKSKSNAK
ncbi:MAG: hypothetical protein HYR84_07260 [Planctomycetes bacterium]|nr:hypothetical protein [Planctomycetota bacterium]